MGVFAAPFGIESGDNVLFAGYISSHAHKIGSCYLSGVLFKFLMSTPDLFSMGVHYPGQTEIKIKTGQLEICAVNISQTS